MLVSWKYVAGFFDGEGSISITTRRVTSVQMVTVSIAQANQTGKEEPPDVLRLIGEFLSKNGIRFNLSGGKKYLRDTRMTTGQAVKPQWPVYNLQIQSRAGISAFLSGVRPYLIVKKVKAEDVLRYFKIFPDMRGYFSNQEQGHISKEMLESDRQNGMTYKAIAEKYGCSMGFVHRKLHLERSRKLHREWRAKQKTA